MSVVFRPIKKVVDKVIDIVEDTGDYIEDEYIDPITDVLDDVADWVVDEIVDPVVDMGQAILKAAGEDPLKAIATIAAIATGQLWLIPLIDGAAVLADGGDLKDAAKAAAISYVAGQAGAAAGNAASAATAEAIGASVSASTASTIANVVGAGTKSATTALVYGQDPLKAFVTGGVNAFVATSLGKVSDTMKTKFNKSFEDLNDGVKDSIYAGISAEVSGGALSPEQLSNVIMKNAAIGGTMENFLEANAGFSEAQASILTNAVTAAVTKTILGNPDGAGDAFFNSISADGAAALKTIINKPVNNAIDNLSGAYDKTEEKALAIDAKTKAYNAIVNGISVTETAHNELLDELNGKFTEQDALRETAVEKKRLFDEFKATNPVLNTENVSKLDALQKEALDTSKTFNSFKENFAKDYEVEYKPALDAYTKKHADYIAQLPDAKTEFDTASSEYETSLKYMNTKYEDLDAALIPSVSVAEKAVALSLRPGIDEDKYRKLNGLEPDVDVFGHYLENYSTAQVFDPADLTEFADKLPYGRGYIYEEESNRYFKDTPDGAVEVDPYIELLGSGRGGPPNWRDDEFTQGYISQFRKNNAPLEFAGRITGDMHSILGDDGPVGGIILGSHFKKLKDAGYDVVPYRDPTLGKTVDGTVEYSEMVKNFEDYKDRLGDEVPAPFMQDPEYGVMQQPVEYTGKTITFDGTTPITAEIQNIVKVAGEYDDAYMEEYFPIGGMLDKNIQGMLPTDVIEAFYDEGYTPPDFETMEKIAAAELTATGEAGSTNAIKVAVDILGNTASIATGAIGQMFDASSGLSVMAGGSPDNYAGIAADYLLNLSSKLESQEWKDNNKKMEGWTADGIARWEKENPGKEMTEYDRVWLQVKSMGGNLATYPGQLLSQNIGSELIQEVMLFGVAGKVADVAKVFYMAAGEKAAAKFATQVGVSTTVALNMLEAYGATASESWDTAYATSLKMNGGDVEKATADALRIAQQGGATALFTTAIMAGVGGADLAKQVFGKDKVSTGFVSQYNLLKDKVLKTAQLALKEGGSEAVEEGVPQLLVATLLKEIDPSFDVTTYVTNATVMGAFTGTGTGAAIGGATNAANINFINASVNATEAIKKVTSADPSSSTITQINPEVVAVMSGTNPDDGKHEATAAALKDAGITDTTLLNNILNTTYDTQYISTAESGQLFQVANPDYVPTPAEVNSFVSNRPESEVASLVATYVDNHYLSAEEVKEAADSAGLDLTDDQIQFYVGQKPVDAPAADFNFALDAIQNNTLYNYDGTVNTYSDPYDTDNILTEPVDPVNVEPPSNDVVEEEEFKPGVDGKVPDGLTPPEAGTITSPVMVDYINEITGETYSAPNSGYTPVEGSGWVVKPNPSIALMPSAPRPDDDLGELIPAEPVDDPLTADDVQDIIDNAVGNLPESASPEDVNTAINDALAGLENISTEDVNTAINDALAELENISTEDVKGIVDDVTAGLTEDVADLETSLTALIEKNNGDVSAALDELANNLGTTEDSILEELGTTEANLTEKFEAGISEVEGSISDLETSLTALIEANDGDVDAALAELANNLGETEADILAELGTTEANLTEKFEAGISEVEGTLGKLASDLAALGIDIDTVTALIGKPATEVTEADVDFVIDLIAQENVSAELTAQYDVTGDGIVDINDQNMLMDNLQGNDVTFADTSMFNPATGLYLQQETDANTTMDAITDLNTNINTNINTQTNALANQSRDEEFRRMRDAGIFQGASVSATTPDTAQIDYFYDFDTIFANPQQAQLFASPYGDVRQNQPVNPSDVKRKRGFSEGGQVEDENDMLLRILGDM